MVRIIKSLKILGGTSLTLALLVSDLVASFQLHPKTTTWTSISAVQNNKKSISAFDPLDLASSWDEPKLQMEYPSESSSLEEKLNNFVLERSIATSMTVMGGLSLIPKAALAGESAEIKQMFDPTQFQPVCPASDGFYRFLKGSVETVVGSDGVLEYGPLIAGGLLRVRLELCVVESFFNEAVGPFIAQNGFNWILPLHETVETFLAGVVFALASTFILLGSTKILTVIFTYTDFLLGAPCRLFGGFSFDRAQGKPVTLDIGFGPFKTRVVGPPDAVSPDGTPVKDDFSAILKDKSAASLVVLGISGIVKAIGEVLKFAREILDAIDLFVGRYLVFWASFYIVIKFLHFKVFPDIIPF